MTLVHSYPVNLLPDPSVFPRSLFDPRWQDPEVGLAVARHHYARLRSEGHAFEGDDLIMELPKLEAAKVAEHRLPLSHAVEVVERHVRFKGGAHNELHRRYAFGGQKPAVNFHAQVVTFGADSEGRFFLRARVGREGGEAGNEVALTAAVFAGGRVIGGLAWHSDMDPAGNVELNILGRSPRLLREFDRLDGVLLRFLGHHHGRVEKKVRDEAALDEAMELFGS